MARTAKMIRDGHKFRRKRKELDMTRAELAAELGVTYETVLRFEQGDRAVKGVYWLALDYLLSLG